MAKNQSNESEAILDTIVATPYKYGFTTNLETEEFEKGLSKEILEKISSKKSEPKFLKKFREKAFINWKKMKSPPKHAQAYNAVFLEQINAMLYSRNTRRN